MEYEKPQEVGQARRRALIRERRPTTSQGFTWPLRVLGLGKGCKNRRQTLFFGKEIKISTFLPPNYSHSPVSWTQISGRYQGQPAPFVFTSTLKAWPGNSITNAGHCLCGRSVPKYTCTPIVWNVIENPFINYLLLSNSLCIISVLECNQCASNLQNIFYDTY